MRVGEHDRRLSGSRGRSFKCVKRPFTERLAATVGTPCNSSGSQVVEILVEADRRDAVWFWMPSRPAISMAAKVRYGLPVLSGKRTSDAISHVDCRLECTARGWMRIGCVRSTRAAPALRNQGTSRLYELVAGVCKRVDCACVLDDAADVVQARFRTALRMRRREKRWCHRWLMLWCTCIPLPLSPTSGLGMNVAVLPYASATLCTQYL